MLTVCILIIVVMVVMIVVTAMSIMVVILMLPALSTLSMWLFIMPIVPIIRVLLVMRLLSMMVPLIRLLVIPILFPAVRCWFVAVVMVDGSRFGGVAVVPPASRTYWLRLIRWVACTLPCCRYVFVPLEVVLLVSSILLSSLYLSDY
jgi:hypothetical protein